MKKKGGCLNLTDLNLQHFGQLLVETFVGFPHAPFCAWRDVTVALLAALEEDPDGHFRCRAMLLQSHCLERFCAWDIFVAVCPHDAFGWSELADYSAEGVIYAVRGMVYEAPCAAHA